MRTTQYWLVVAMVFLVMSCAKKPGQSLQEAAANGDAGQIHLHISRGADVNRPD